MFLQPKFPLIASLLSIVPGLGHLYLHKYKKALGLLFIFLGILITLIVSTSYVLKLLAIGIYVLTFIPAGIEAFQYAKHDRLIINTNHPKYVIFLLLTTGFSALPLLWGSQEFSRHEKIRWTWTVILLALFFYVGLLYFWKPIEDFLQAIFP